MKTLFIILCLASTLTASAAVPVDVLDGLASPDLAKRYSAHISLRNLVFEARKPGASKNDVAAMEKELLDLAANPSTALVSRLWVLEQLPYLATSTSVPGLKSLMADPNAHVRDEARRALQNISDPSASIPIIEALKTANEAPWVMGLIDSLAARRETAAVPVIAAHLTSQNDAIVAVATQSLGTIGGKASLDILSKFLPSCPAAILPTAQSALIRCAIPLAKIPLKAEDVLIALWPQAANASIRCQIFSALANEDDGAKAAPLITELLDQQDTPGAREIFNLAILSGNPILAAPILEALPGLGEDTRLAVHTALAQKSDTSQEADLLALAQALDGNKQSEAIKLLGDSGTHKSLDFLSAEAAKKDSQTFPAVRIAINRLKAPGLDQRLIADAQGSLGTQKNQALMLLTLRNPAGTEGLLVTLSAPDASADSREAALTGLEIVGGYGTATQLLKWIAEMPQGSDPKPFIGTFRRTANRLSASSLLWKEAFVPAFESAPRENRVSLLQTVPSLRCKESSESLVSWIRADATLRSHYIEQLVGWSDFTAGDSLLAAASVPDLDPACLEKIFQAANKLFFPNAGGGSSDQKKIFAEKVLAAAPEGTIRDSVVQAMSDAKL